MLYPAGVSLYSVALIACPSLLMTGRSQLQRSRRAGWIYSIAGWGGSSLGIGMAEHLHRVPVAFVAVAALLFSVPLISRFAIHRARETAAILAVLLASWGIARMLFHPVSTVPMSPVDCGRRVYISEGCIHCHSQYVRPGSADVELWGPAGNLEAIRQEKPPLIGNRRQGPDLSNVGARRSPLWLRMHLIDPRSLAYGSIMPSYAYLFRDSRGSDLVTYLESLKNSGSSRHLRTELATWTPDASPVVAERNQGRRLFDQYCATCHDRDGAARTRWGSLFKVQPPNLTTDALSGSGPGTQLNSVELARIIKFGMPGTDMPGHEYLSDPQIMALAGYVTQLRQH